MINTIFQLQIICELIIFLSVVFMNIGKKNTSLVNAYFIQSIALIILLCIQSYQEHSGALLLVTLCMLFVKAIIAPRIFLRFIHANKENFSSSTYLNVPLTLGVIILLSIFAQSDVFLPLSSFIPQLNQIRLLLIGSICIAVFLTINRRGALSQIIGVLALENSIFAFGHFLGVKQSISLELGILFDVLFWIVIASMFIKMLYKHYGSLDVSELRQLQK